MSAFAEEGGNKYALGGNNEREKGVRKRAKEGVNAGP